MTVTNVSNASSFNAGNASNAGFVDFNSTGATGAITMTGGVGNIATNAVAPFGGVNFYGGTAAVNVALNSIVGCIGGLGNPFDVSVTTGNGRWNHHHVFWHSQH